MGKSRASLEVPLVLESLTRAGVSHDLITAGLEPKLQDVVNAVEHFLSEVDEAKRSNRYTQAGLADLANKAAGEARRKLILVQREVVQRYRERIRELLTQARAKLPRRGDDAASFLRQWELRTLLREQDQLRRDFLYKEAIRTGDVELLDAAEGAPRAFPIVSAALIEESQSARLKAAAPEIWKDIEDLTSVARALEGTIATAEQDLAKAGHPAQGEIKILNAGVAEHAER